MATEAEAIVNDWGGGVHPYRVGHRKLGMWLFIMSDSLTFSALLIGYAYVRASNVWPTPFKFSPSIVFSSIMTLVLLSSSLTMVMAVSASAHAKRSTARKWILFWDHWHAHVSRLHRMHLSPGRGWQSQ